jgi:hypothetical protein
MIGRTIGKYRIVDQLGRGGMGAVYRAVDETLDREVAVKVLNPGLEAGDVMKRFRTEAMTLARLNHPEIATIHEIYRFDQDLLMVMELVRGETLDQLSQRSGPLPPERAAYLVAQVLGALGHAHQAGIVHRDLKPANVMVTETGGIKITDFGIARVSGAEHLTVDGQMMGTPAYMAPEQVLGQEVDGRADLYSCGVLFYRLLTGALPFEADTAIGMVQKALSDPPTPAHVHRADLPDWCQTILDRALAKSPAARFQTAEEFRAALMSAIGSVATEQTGAYAAARLPDLPSPTGTTPAALPRPAVATGRTPKPQTPGEGATIVLQRNHFAIAGILLTILAVGVAVLAVVALRRQPAATNVQSTADQPAVTETPAPTSTTSPEAAPETAPEVPPTSTEPAPPAVESTASSAAPEGATASASRALPKAGARASSAVEASRTSSPAPRKAVSAAAAASAPPPGATTTSDQPSAKAATPPAPAAPAAAHEAPAGSTKGTREAIPPFIFAAKAVVAEGGKNREHDVTTLLADGKITVTEKNNAIVAAIPYSTIVAIDSSDGKQPLWNSPQGPAEVLKVEQGAFGFLKGGHQWLALRTKQTTLVLHVEDSDLHRVIVALQERTGHNVVRVVGKD